MPVLQEKWISEPLTVVQALFGERVVFSRCMSSRKMTDIGLHKNLCLWVGLHGSLSPTSVDTRSLCLSIDYRVEG